MQEVTSTENTILRDKSRKSINNLISQNGACLVGELFPHPVGVFCSHLEPPKCHIGPEQIIYFPIYPLTLISIAGCYVLGPLD